LMSWTPGLFLMVSSMVFTHDWQVIPLTLITTLSQWPAAVPNGSPNAENPQLSIVSLEIPSTEIRD
jgi:hypothetical protein